MNILKPKTRTQRLAELVGSIMELYLEFDLLKDELRKELDSLPEDQKTGERGETLDTAIADLEELMDPLSEAELKGAFPLPEVQK